MSRPQKSFKVNGVKMTSEEWAKRYKITRNCLLNRLSLGYRMEENRMVPPGRKIYESGNNLPATSSQHQALQESFIGDCEDDSFSW